VLVLARQLLVRLNQFLMGLEPQSELFLRIWNCNSVHIRKPTLPNNCAVISYSNHHSKAII
jgi:hypothetical protein